MYYAGQRVRQDYAEAVQWFRKAEQGVSKPTIIWVICITMGKEYVKTMRR